MPTIKIHRAKTHLSHLIAQSQDENLPILSNDTVFDTYKLRRLWV
jgi:PIN domain nuclease of toxin-antitoxin system